jgi:hypothetical protein
MRVLSLQSVAPIAAFTGDPLPEAEQIGSSDTIVVSAGAFGLSPPPPPIRLPTLT